MSLHSYYKLNQNINDEDCFSSFIVKILLFNPMFLKNYLRFDALENRQLLAVADMTEPEIADPIEDLGTCSEEILEKAALWDAYLKSLVTPWEVIPAGTSFTFTDPVFLWNDQNGGLRTEFEWIIEKFGEEGEKIDEYDLLAKCTMTLLQPYTPDSTDTAEAEDTTAEAVADLGTDATAEPVEVSTEEFEVAAEDVATLDTETTEEVAQDDLLEAVEETTEDFATEEEAASEEGVEATEEVAA